MNQSELTRAFRNAGIQNGMILEVHSSLSSFGFVAGGANSVIEALMECVGKAGSIFMPALRFSPKMELMPEDKALGIHMKIKILSESAERSGMGIISDTFRSRNDVITSSGIFAASGWGLHGDQVLNGGLDYAIQHGGKALLLGVDIYSLTAMHYVENNLPSEIKQIFAPSEAVNKQYSPEEWLIEMGEPPVKPWYTIQRMAYEKGLIQDGFIGSCKYMLFNLWDVVRLYQTELERNPLKLYGL